MDRQYGVFDTLFAKIGWVKSKDSNGFDVYSIPDGVILNERPSSWDPSAMHNGVFMDGISFEEDTLYTCSNGYISVTKGNIHLGTLSCIFPFLKAMMERRSTCIIFPDNISKDIKIKSILEVFPGKYTEEQLKAKQFVSSNGNRKARDL